MKSKRLVCLVVMVVAITLVQPLVASTFTAMDRTEMVGASVAVVEGEVLSTVSYWNRDSSMIFTDVMLLVRDRHHGDSASVVKIKTFGGEVDGYRVEGSGFARFTVGDRAFVFLRPDELDPDMLRVTGHQLGHYDIVARPDGVEWAVPTVDEGMHLVTRELTQASAPAAMPLADLRQEVRALSERLEGDETDRPVN